MRRSTQELLVYGAGGYGGVISTGNVVTGEFMAVQILETATFTAVSGDIDGIDKLDAEGISLSAGTVLFGKFTYIEPASGSILAYYA